MIKYLPGNIIRFVILVLTQVIILNHVHFSGYVNPMVYLMFILLLPFETPPWFMIILGFVTGLSVDVFSGTMGLHASATTMAAFIRKPVLIFIAPRDGYEPGSQPDIKHMGWFWFSRYAVIMILAHHIWLFTLEVFRFSDYHHTLLRIIISSVFSFVLIVLLQAILTRRN